MNGILLFGVMAIYLLICVAWGLLRGLTRSRIRCISVIACAVIAFFATIAVKSSLLNESNIRQIQQFLQQKSPEAAELLGLSPELQQSLLSCIGAIAAPSIFLALFIVLSFLTWFVFLIVTLILSHAIRKHDSNRPLKTLRTLILAVVQGLVVIAVFMVPIASYLEIAPEVTDKLLESDVLDAEQEKIVQESVDQAVKPMNETGAVVVFRRLGGGVFCNNLTDFSLDGKTIHLKDEIGSVASFGYNIYGLSKTEIEEYSDSQAQMIRELADSFEDSLLLPSVGGEVIYFATDAWIKDETFLNVAKPELNPIIDPVFDRFLLVIHDDARDRDALCEDIRTLADMVASLAEHGVFAGLSDTDQLMVSLGSEGVVEDLINILGANENMKVLIPEITNMGMRAIAASLNIPEDTTGIYSQMLNDIATALNETKSETDPAARINAMTDKLQTAFEDAGVAIDADILDSYSVAIINDLGALDNVTPAYVEEFFKLYALTAENKQPKDSTDPIALTVTLDSNDNGFVCPAYSGKTLELLKEKSGAAVLSKVHVQLSQISKENQVEFEQAASQILLDGFSELLAEDANKDALINIVKNIPVSKIDVGNIVDNTVSLRSAKEMKTDIITLKDLVIDTEVAAEKLIGDQLSKEAAAIQSIFQNASTIISSVDGKDINLAELGTSVGSVMNTLKTTSSFGSQMTANLFTAVLQSETVRKSANMDIKTATNIAKKATDGDVDYSKTMSVMSQSIDLAKTLSSDDKASEEDIRKLLNDMTPQTAGMVQEYITPERMKGYGLNEQRAQASSDMIRSLFGYMAKIDQENCANEAAAISEMLNIATAAKNSTSTVLFGGRLPLATELVGKIMKSEAVCNSLIENLTDGTKVTSKDPFGISSQIPAGQADDLACNAAIQTYRSESKLNNTWNDKTDLRLQAIGALFGVDIVFII